MTLSQMRFDPSAEILNVYVTRESALTKFGQKRN